MMTHEALAKLAVEARKTAYAPYSGFFVGAALLAKNGTVYTGCNIENAAFTPTNCGERTAFFKAVSQGERAFSAIAIAGWKDGETPGFAYPCGVCRQVMMEFCDPDDFTVIVTDGETLQAMSLAEVFPYGFGPGDLAP